MPATVTTRENIEKSTPMEALQEEVNLRIMAGAIRSKIIDMQTCWVIETEWNVIGQQ